MNKEQKRFFKQQRKKQKLLSKKQKSNITEQKFQKVNFDGIIFVFGNGTSRADIEPSDLKKIAPVYGCNALYRSFVPDVLVAVDSKMIHEISKSGYQNHHPVWTNPNRNFEKIPNLNFFKPSKGWSSGPTALWYAAQQNPLEIYILGFDFRGLQDGKKFNNVYSDTENYKKSSDNATFFGNWLRQTRTVIKDNPTIIFHRVIETHGFIPKDLIGFENLHHITVQEFKKKFNL